MLLNLKEIRIHYGKAEIIQGVTMGAAEGLITGLIGANGAGKSTILKAISGLHPITSGEIWFQNKRIDRMASHQIVRLGVVQVPERRRLFPYMSVLRNIKMGAYLRKDKIDLKEDLKKIFQRFPRLLERCHQRAETLSGGEQQMLAIGRALMAKPRLLIMDEPSLGLAPLVVESLATVIREIHREGMDVLLVEQNARLAFKLTDVVYVLEVGKVALEGKTKELINHEIVRKAFLGGQENGTVS
jgi:branched-chain amino acid transport system ATP-binding protein